MTEQTNEEKKRNLNSAMAAIMWNLALHKKSLTLNFIRHQWYGKTNNATIIARLKDAAEVLQVNRIISKCEKNCYARSTNFSILETLYTEKNARRGYDFKEKRFKPGFVLAQKNVNPRFFATGKSLLDVKLTTEMLGTDMIDNILAEAALRRKKEKENIPKK